MWEVGKSGEDPGKIRRSGRIRCSGVSGEEESGRVKKDKGEEVIGVSQGEENGEWEGVQREATRGI